MAFDDLRSFLQALDDQGQLLKISEEVNAEPDLAAAATPLAVLATAHRRYGSIIFVVLPTRVWR